MYSKYTNSFHRKRSPSLKDGGIFSLRLSASKLNLPKALPFGEGGFAKQRRERFEALQNTTSSVLTAAESLVNPPSPKGKAFLTPTAETSVSASV